MARSATARASGSVAKARALPRKVLRGTWSRRMSKASAPAGVESQSDRSPVAAVSWHGLKRASTSASKAGSLQNHFCGPAARQKASTSSGVVRALEPVPSALTTGAASQPHPAGTDAVVERSVEAHEGVGGGIVEIDRVADHAWIEALLHEVDLLHLARAAHPEVRAADN